MRAHPTFALRPAWWVRSALVCTLALSLAQCKDEPTAPEVAAEDLVAPVNQQTVAALEGKTFTFPNGGSVISPALAGQTISMTLTNTTSATPTAAFTFPSGSITTSLTFGSCIFNVTSVSGNSPLSVGQTFTVNPCNLRVNTAGKQVGTQTSTTATITLGTVNSQPVTVTVEVREDGTVVVEGTEAGKVTVTVATGTTGSG